MNKGLEIRFRSDWNLQTEQDSSALIEENVNTGQTKDITYKFEGGIQQFVETLNANRAVLHTNPIYIEKQVEKTMVEVALQYHDLSLKHI